MVGQLNIRPHTIGTRDSSALIAELLLENGDNALPPLHKAQVRRMTRGGIMIAGTDLVGRDTAKARVRSYQQTWWCLLVSDTALRRLAGTHLSELEQSAGMRRE